MLPEGSRVIAAVSGGADSVCLVHVLRELGCDLTGIAHLNHKLRGEASDQDEQFVGELARSLGLPFHTASASIRELLGNLEQNARRARREFFSELIAAGYATRIALGHTRDDQAETVLFRLLRGSGLSGLAGILPVTDQGLIRPLLGVGRADVLLYLRERGLAWREDATNQCSDFARNRIRQSLLPQLAQEWNPGITVALNRLADVAYEEENWWQREVSRLAPDLLRVSDGAVELCVRGLASLDRAPLRRVIRHALGLAKGSLTGIEYGHIESVASLIASDTGSGRVTLPGVMAVRSFDWLLLAKPSALRSHKPGMRIDAPGIYPWPESKPLIKLEILSDPPNSYTCDTLETSSVDLELRGWRVGDRYRPLGRSGETKIKELFQKARIPSWRRSSWPILTGNGKILWAKEFGPAAGPSVLQVREIPLDG